MLVISRIYAGYGELEVLRGVDIIVEPQSIVALIGPNGAGKSTVIKSIFNLADVTKGTITFNGKNITHSKTHELIEHGISYVNQGHVVFGNLNVKENLEIGAHHMKDRDVIKKNMERIFAKFPRLKERQKQLAYSLSGGEQQMLALGRALMHDPALLLLDEPSLGLSPKLQKELFRTVEELRSDGLAILVVEQNAKKAIEIADKTYVLEDGKIVLTGGKEIIKNEKIKNVYLGGR